jgi:hypothetical protein
MILIGRLGKLASVACALAGADSGTPHSPSNPTLSNPNLSNPNLSNPKTSNPAECRSR